MEPSDVAPRRSKREHQPSAKAAASLSSSTFAAASSSVSSAARRSQRRRVTRSASPASLPVASSPVRGAAPPPASTDPSSIIVDAVGPNGQRRRLRAAAHTTTSSGVSHGVHSGLHADGKVLGRYSSHDCALLCEAILGQLKRQTLSATVLLEGQSPAFIRWEPVAKKMETTHKLRMTPSECQLLWKFLAYGQVPGGEDELLPDSDEEDFHRSPNEINARLAAERVKADEEKSGADVAVKSDEVQATATEKAAVQAEEVTTEAALQDAQDKADEEKLQSDTQDGEPSVRLYPTYSLPTGAPDAWFLPFGPKDALPLTFVASRFLRRKVNPLPMQSVLGKSTPATSSYAAAAADLKRKQAVPVNSAAASKKTKVATPAVSTPPRVFTPSSTPPPAAKRARSELEFFELRLREDLTKTAPGSKFELSAADIQRRFGEASADVRRQCQVLATHDVERFNREVVRVRIWQKAMGTNNVKLKPTLAPASAAPSQTQSAKPASIASAGTIASSSAKLPAAAQSSGRAAALLAHAAAVAAIAAKVKNPSPTGTTAGAPKATQEQKDGGSASAKPEAKK